MGYQNELLAGQEPPDFTDKFNTELSADEERQFQQWAKKAGRDRDLVDYDMRGAWKAGAAESEGGHYPDTYKKPNHPTFSDESKYSGTEGYQGGQWSKRDGKDVFKPGPTSMIHPDDLGRYFKEVEPDAILERTP